ncbi:MAG: bifunctional DNA primase/polymerase [Terracidiphilus sp.]
MSSSQWYKIISFAAEFPEPEEEPQAPSIEVDLSRLPNALLRAVQEKWEIAPVSAHSKFASLTRACLAEPSNDPAVIAKCFDWFPKANWCARTGRGSNLVVLDVDHAAGQDSLSDLCLDRFDAWSDTLRFNDDRATFFLFHYPAQGQLRHLSRRFQGLRIHADNLLLLPPSWLVAAPRLAYSSLAPVQDCPGFLTDDGPNRESAARVIPFPPNKFL